MPEHVILVDEHDHPVGEMEKLAAHEKGLLHRAISVLVFNTNGELLVQQRAAGKYHCPLLWANTCCSHPRKDEQVLAAAHRRLQEEMGFDCPLEECFSFTYRAVFGNGLIEHEFDHVLVGTYDGAVHPNPEEVAAYDWRALPMLRAQIKEHPEQFAAWFVIILERIGYEIPKAKRA